MDLLELPPLLSVAVDLTRLVLVKLLGHGEWYELVRVQRVLRQLGGGFRHLGEVAVRAVERVAPGAHEHHVVVVAIVLGVVDEAARLRWNRSTFARYTPSASPLGTSSRNPLSLVNSKASTPRIALRRSRMQFSPQLTPAVPQSPSRHGLPSDLVSPVASCRAPTP